MKPLLEKLHQLVILGIICATVSSCSYFEHTAPAKEGTRQFVIKERYEVEKLRMQLRIMEKRKADKTGGQAT